MMIRATWVSLIFVFMGFSVEAKEDSLFNTEIYTSPWKGETVSKGDYSIFHKGKGELPKKGYFKKHEPGETAEFHLYVPKGLDPNKKYPLLIVYHGGKDGASGKGTGGRFARLSTKKHPVIVLSPNMYTMDAYNELIAEGKLPIDRNRVIVYGHSSGGMGVLSAMREFVRTKGKFVPATLMSASTTASMGRTKYPPCPYYVIAGERETPEFIKNKILKNRRRTCRLHSLIMQQVFSETRYIEIQGSGHSGGTPKHAAIIQHAIAVSKRSPVEFVSTEKAPQFQALIQAVQAGSWIAARKEISRFDAMKTLKERTEYNKLRKAIFKSLENWFVKEVDTIAGVTPQSNYLQRDRAFRLYDSCQQIVQAYADTPAGETLAKTFKKLDKAKHWQAEQNSKKEYLKIVSVRPTLNTVKQLQALRKSAPQTEYGRNRTREKLQALQIFSKKTAEVVKLSTSDNKSVFGSLNKAKEKNDKIVLLFHQARSNRHEYDPIFPLINKEGFDTLAIDQRSGGRMWGKENLTVKANGKSTDYASALPDLQAAVDWAVKRKYKTIITVGSSYTAALNFVLAKQNSNKISAIASFSPGEYLGKKWSVAKEAKGLTMPVYVTSGSAKKEIQMANDILKNAQLKQLTRHKPSSGVHGASTLREKRNPKGYKANREDFMKFLKLQK